MGWAMNAHSSPQPFGKPNIRTRPSTPVTAVNEEEAPDGTSDRLPAGMAPRSAALGIAALAVAGCTRNGGPIELFTPPPPPEVAYVSPDGGDLADGTEASPFATLARALRSGRPRIVLLPGVFPEPEVVVSREVIIEGAERGRAVLDGHLFVSGAEVTVRRLEVTGGIATHLARGLSVEGATVAAGAKDDALSLVSSVARLEDLALECGPETCLQATSATVSAARVRARATRPSKRIFRVETSSVSLRDVELVGGGVAQLQAGLGSHLYVRGATLSDSAGSGLAAVRDAEVVAERIRVRGARRMSLLVQRAVATVIDSELGSTPELTVGVTGGDLTVRTSTVHGSAGGALSLSANGGVRAEVLLQDSLLRHLERDGAQVSGGTLTVRGGRFVGDGRPGDGPGDAIVAHGDDARVHVEGARFERPRNFAVVLNGDAVGTITATVSDAGRGGVLIDDVAVAPVRLEGLVVVGCREGSGVVALRTPAVEVVGGRVTGCAEAGYLAGAGTRMTIRGATATGNLQYGFAAFGGSTVVLEHARASGSRWAAFASCGEGARVEVGEGVELSGKTALCP